ALDRDGRELAGHDERIDGGPHGPLVADPVVVVEVGDRRDAVRAGGTAHEFVDRFLAWEIEQNLRGEHRGGEAVDALESVAARDRDLPNAPEVFEGALDVIPIPPGTATGLPLDGEDLARLQRPAFSELGLHAVDDVGVLERPPAPAPGSRAHGLAAEAPQRP